MNIQQMKEIIEQDIEETKEHIKYLETEIAPILTEAGKISCNDMVIYHLGYLGALQKIMIMFNLSELNKELNIDGI